MGVLKHAVDFASDAGMVFIFSLFPCCSLTASLYSTEFTCCILPSNIRLQKLFTNLVLYESRPRKNSKVDTSFMSDMCILSDGFGVDFVGVGDWDGEKRWRGGGGCGWENAGADCGEAVEGEEGACCWYVLFLH